LVHPGADYEATRLGSLDGMRVVVTGATGNVGTSVVRALAADPRVEEIVGVARRPPRWSNPRTRWVSADVVTSSLEPVFDGAEAVIHLAWLIQPSHDAEALRAVNVDGSRRVFEATVRAGAKVLVHASSVGVYSPGPKERRVDESWPNGGVPTLFYARHKAEAERLLDDLESEVRIVRLRPGLIFKREAASEIRRLFIGPLLPSPLVQRRFLPLLPLPPGLALQAVHADDVGEAYRLAVTSPDARGAYNIAAEPVLDEAELGRLLGARPVAVPARAVRAAASATWRARLQPTPPGWLDMGLGVPLMDTTRAREELGWTARHSASDALLELLDGLRRSAGFDTPPLAPKAGGRLRFGEIPAGSARTAP
jgi:nucleoside-diphosphate-sugar epimerase